MPVNPARTYKVHAWDDWSTWELDPTPHAGHVDFPLPRSRDARELRFMFHAADPQTDRDTWERDDFIRRIRVAAPTDVWSFDFTARILYRAPSGSGTALNPGDVVTVHVISQRRFKGGRIFAWNPYDAAGPSAYFDEWARADPESTFSIPLASWMIAGFHFKLVGPRTAGKDDLWEPDGSNRVWTPADGKEVWIKSGQVSVRGRKLALGSWPIEVQFPASLGSPPLLDLVDPVEQLHQRLEAVAVNPVPAAPLFRIGRYDAPIYADAVYELNAPGAEGEEPLVRPFPARPGVAISTSRFVLGAGGWVPALPAASGPVQLVIQPRPASAFSGGVTIEAGVGAAPAHDAVAGVRQADGTWLATVTVPMGVRTWVKLIGAGGAEPRPYESIDIRRFFTSDPAVPRYFTAEGVYGLSKAGTVTFGEPPSRIALMRAAFGTAAGVFDAGEMPHGPTRDGTDMYFVLHAPHAAWARLVLIDDAAAGGPARRHVSMTLTGDCFYWWCKVLASDVPAGTRYRFALNDDVEVMDPAARDVLDSGSFETTPADAPADATKSWSLVSDIAAIAATAHSPSWRTMGWEALLLYELHPKRFTDLGTAALAWLDVLADELKATSRLGRPGYLRALPITALQLMPVHEFRSTNSWGYNPAFFFAVDSHYGGAPALACLVQEAHRAGRAVLLDLVYNHMNDSPLTRIAPEVYRNGDAWGDRIYNAHPMVRQFFRQATVYLWRTFGLDGFRFDSTKTIVENDGWGFLDAIRKAVRDGATADEQPWPYFVGENDPKFWDITDTRWGVMDGQWDITEVYDLGFAAYDPWNASDDHAQALKSDLEVPHSWGRPFFEAMRFGESHDSVSGQDPGNRRIAARPPYHQGLQMAKAIGAISVLSKGVPMVFMGEEVGETRYFSFDSEGPATNPQAHDLPDRAATDNTRVLGWFRSLMGLRNDGVKGLRGDDSVQVVRTGRRTVAFTCGSGQQLFIVATFGTEDQQQDSSWLGLPRNGRYKEILNSSWPVFQVEFEQERTNGGYAASIQSGQLLNLPFIGAVVLERV